MSDGVILGYIGGLVAVGVGTFIAYVLLSPRIAITDETSTEMAEIIKAQQQQLSLQAAHIREQARKHDSDRGEATEQELYGE